jgi:mitotic spindle assembly checkpoint protein MAD2B
MPPTPNTYKSLITTFTDFLTVAVHTILYIRHCYPATSFISSKAYNYPIHQSRHPKVCTWINDAITSIQQELLKGIVDRIAIVITNEDGKPLERFIFDVARFVVVGKGDWYVPISRDGDGEGAGSGAVEKEGEETVDMSEQFRAVLARLSTCHSTLKPIPHGCSFTIAIELKEASDPPLKHPQAWMPVEPSVQRTVGIDADGFEEVRKGEDLGGVRTVAVRSVEAGEMCFEMWIEEGKGKEAYTRDEESLGSTQTSD